VATVEDVVTVLANRALERHDSDSGGRAESPNGDGGADGEGSPVFHMNELMEILPRMQFGLDVNPKFNAPNSVEYTSGLSTFDLLGVELVHGWLIDPQDERTCTVIGNKSYNELVEEVIKGSESTMKVSVLQSLIEDKEKEIQSLMSNQDDKQDGKDTVVTNEDSDTNQSQHSEEIENANKSVLKNETKDEEMESENETTNDKVDTKKDAIVIDDDKDEKEYVDVQKEFSVNDVRSVESEEENNRKIEEIEKDIAELKEKQAKHCESVSKGEIINLFLDETSHQLTYYGVEQLNTFVQEYQLCIFFRNNHFSTMLKYKDGLYLLVTDLGYANVQDIVWERLDTIDGNTEYVNGNFLKPAPQESLSPQTFLSAEQLLAQEGQNSRDYQLAMQLQKGGDQSVDAGEAALLHAATEASLQEYNGTPATVGDHAMAMKLQQQYDVIEANQRNQQEMLRKQQLREKQKKEAGSGCIIS